jgi:hypothetical protein
MGAKQMFAAVMGKKTESLTIEQRIDLACSLMCITERHLTIDSARAMIHVSYVQAGRFREKWISFNDIAEAVNGKVGAPVPPTRLHDRSPSGPPVDLPICSPIHSGQSPP